MTIEEKVFLKSGFDPEKMRDFGFVNTGAGYSYTADFMDGDFRAEIFVTKDGSVCGRVVDTMNDEEYAPLRAVDFDGPFVSTVRAAYEALLQHVAKNCCVEKPFVSAQANRITGMIFGRWGVRPDFPWGDSPYDGAGVFRHLRSGKWFALIMRIKRLNLLKNGDETPLDAVNLKIDPGALPSPTEKDGVFPAYHMNHKHWITVVLDDTLSDDAVMALLESSFYLTETKKDRIEQPET